MTQVPVLKNQKTQATATLHKYVGANGALSTFNRLEETVDGAQLCKENGKACVSLEFRPFEIKTVKVYY